MPAAGIVLIIVVLAIVGVAAAYLIPTIFVLARISRALNRAIVGVGELVTKTEPVEPVVADINANLDAAVSALEGLLVKKAGLLDAMGLLDGLYPGAARAGLRGVPESTAVRPPRIGEVYTRGVLTLARLGREAPIAAASPEGPVLRHVDRSEHATDALYPNFRPKDAPALPRSPVIGTDAPVQYEPALTPGVRLRTPTRPATTPTRPATTPSGDER
jgi:hypothetical protein